jgi:hypothetical protein
MCPLDPRPDTGCDRRCGPESAPHACVDMVKELNKVQEGPLAGDAELRGEDPT